MTDPYQRLFENNRAWVASKLAEDPDFFTKLATEQHPDFLFIGCSDSRVPANEIMGLEPGEVFVHRNIANLVGHTDLNAQAVIHYAVEHLDVKHIIVCGHYGCGGVRAALKPLDLGLLNGWLRQIRDVYRLHRPQLDALMTPQARERRLIELNVQEQCVNVIKTAVVQRSFKLKGYPRVHGWVYDLSDGIIKDLKIPFEDVLASIQHIYDLEV